MKTIQVNASKIYNVYVDNHLLEQTGDFAAAVKTPCKVAIISDSNVWPIYGNTVSNSLVQAGFEVIYFMFPAGEHSKSPSTYLEILSFLACNHITRSDLLIALGGGVVGDITGFAAATYLRGISYIQIPTTLLAMVDSSVGGKTAIDLPAGKNLVGAFYQPELVICDISTLNTLSDHIYRDGCAEIIKYGILYDCVLFEHLKENGRSFDQISVIAKCIELKRDVVARDEFDLGQRQMLNLGHTIGHGIEAESNFTVSHGAAVAIGMAIVSRAGVTYKICQKDTCDQILAVLDKFGLPISTDCTAQSLYQNALSDKKRSGGTVNLIIPQKIGSCIIRTTAVAELLSFIKAGL